MLSPAMAPAHIPVLAEELLHALQVVPGGLYIDCTVGAGGHAAMVLEAASPGGRLLGIDADPRALRTADRRLKQFNGSYRLANDNFSNIAQIASANGFERVNGVYFDLGLSSLQLAEAGRGFSFLRDEPLDMRFSDNQVRTAADLVNSCSVEELARVLRTYGEEPRSWAIARRIADRRPIRTTGQLARLVEQAAPQQGQRIHAATRTFQALRIWVNNELANLEHAIQASIKLLGTGGRLAVISFHSLEDRIVKTIFQRESKDCICPPKIPACVCGHVASLHMVTRKVIVPTLREIQFNQRSRSAKLRVAQKL